MKLPPSLLTKAEKDAFTRWLKKLFIESKMNRSAFSAAMGDGSTTRLSRYLDHGRIPTKEALSEIARIGEVPYAFACFKAGYLDEAIIAISEHLPDWRKRPAM